MRANGISWSKVVASLVTWPLALVFCLPGAAVLVESVRRSRAFALEWWAEGTAVFLVGAVVVVCLFSRWAVARSTGWAVAFMGHAALANALSPGREANVQVIWLGVGAVLGALAGLLLGVLGNRRRVAEASGPGQPPAGAQPAATAPPRRHVAWPALGVAAVAVCVVAASAVRYTVRVARQAKIREAVARCQGWTVSDHSGTPTLVFSWLDRVPRGDEHHCLSGVVLGPSAGDQQLAELMGLGLERLPHLRGLMLAKSRVTDDGLTTLAPLRQLERLSLSHAITDAGLVHLRDLAALQHLDLSHTRVTGQGLRSAYPLPRLTFLVLRQTQITDADLAELKPFSCLTFVDLSGTPITDAGVVHLKELPNLSTLVLMKTRITDASVKHLVQVPQLRWLFVNGTEISPAGAKEIARARPSLWLEW